MPLPRMCMGMMGLVTKDWVVLVRTEEETSLDIMVDFAS